MLKKFLSTLIIFTILGSSPFLKTVNAEDTLNFCENKNKCGNTEDLVCAITEAQEKLKHIGGYINLNEIGKNCEYDISLWDYNSIGDLPMIISKNLDMAKTNVAINEFVRFIEDKKGSSNNLNESLSDFLKSDSRFASISIKQLMNSLFEKYRAEKEHNKLKLLGSGTLGLGVGGALALAFPFLGVPLMVLGGTATAFGSLATYGVIHSLLTSKNNEAELKQSLTKIRNYISAAKHFLSHINNGDWSTADSVLLQVNSDEKSAEGGIVTMLKSKLNYTDEEKQKFNDRFNTVKADLEQIIDQYKAEKWD